MTDQPSTELARRAEGFGMTPHERYLYAQSLAPARQLPAMLRGSVADVLLRVEYGVSIGVPPISAISAVHVVDGKPTASAGLMSALVRKAGHRFRVWTEPDPDFPGEKKAIATVIRADDPDFEYRSEWTIERAIAAKLLKLDGGKLSATKSGSAWDTYRPGMLKARATTEVCRDACEDVLLGVHYSPEELGAPVDANGEPILDAEIVSETHSTTENPYATPPEQQRPAGPAEGEVDADLLGAAIRNARSRVELREGLVRLDLARPEPTAKGGYAYKSDLLKATEIVRDVASGELVSAWDLFVERGRSLPDETPPDGDGGSARESGETPPPGDAPAAGAPDVPPAPSEPVQSRSEPRTVTRSQGRPAEPDPWATDAPEVAHPDDPAAPGSVYACHVVGCVEPETHSTADHVSWSQGRRVPAPPTPGEPSDIVDAELVEDDPTDRGLPAEPTPETTAAVASANRSSSQSAAQIARDEARAKAREATKATQAREAGAPKT